MRKVLELKPKEHVYLTDTCSGCGIDIKGTYHEIGLHHDERIEHIALCGKCYQISLNEGVI